MTMYTSPPPGSGVLLAFMMKVLNGFVSNQKEKIMLQRLVETYKWAYARRTELGDPDFEPEVSKLTNFLQKLGNYNITALLTEIEKNRQMRNERER